ncbi:MAG: hypothetical protein K2L77_02855, partial [Muribaculaceae bacterium]|nr:hypothetical protein [Muribaculaceae bacterium]
MKKLLFSFLPVLLVVLSGIRSYAADYSVTVQWDTPGSIEVIKGSSPTLATSVKLDLAADQTSLTFTQDDYTDGKPENIYWFIPAADYKLTGASEKVGNNASIVDMGGGANYFKLQLQYASSQTALNGKTFTLDVAPMEYAGSFTINVDNGAELLRLQLADADNNKRTINNIVNGSNTVKFTEGETTLIVSTTNYKALYEVRSGSTVYEYAGFQYKVPISDGSEVFIAAIDPALASTKHKVSFTFVNECKRNFMLCRG